MITVKSAVKVHHSFERPNYRYISIIVTLYTGRHIAPCINAVYHGHLFESIKNAFPTKNRLGDRAQ